VAFFASANAVCGLWNACILLYQLLPFFIEKWRSGAFWASEWVGATDSMDTVASTPWGTVIFEAGVESNPEQSFIDETGGEALPVRARICLNSCVADCS